MSMASIYATTFGIALYRSVVGPWLRHYRAWKIGPRVQTARRNWRGVYVPDLGIKRAERTLWLALTCFAILGVAVTWTALTMPR